MSDSRDPDLAERDASRRGEAVLAASRRPGTLHGARKDRMGLGDSISGVRIEVPAEDVDKVRVEGVGSKIVAKMTPASIWPLVISTTAAGANQVTYQYRPPDYTLNLSNVRVSPSWRQKLSRLVHRLADRIGVR